MPRYRTEIVIPQDRSVTLLLPDHLPVGRATLTVTVHPQGAGDEEIEGTDGPDPADTPSPGNPGDDYEWWEEFEGGPGGPG